MSKIIKLSAETYERLKEIEGNSFNERVQNLLSGIPSIPSGKLEGIPDDGIMKKLDEITSLIKKSIPSIPVEGIPESIPEQEQEQFPFKPALEEEAELKEKKKKVMTRQQYEDMLSDEEEEFVDKFKVNPSKAAYEGAVTQFGVERTNKIVKEHTDHADLITASPRG